MPNCYCMSKVVVVVDVTAVPVFACRGGLTISGRLRGVCLCFLGQGQARQPACGSWELASSEFRVLGPPRNFRGAMSVLPALGSCRNWHRNSTLAPLGPRGPPRDGQRRGACPLVLESPEPEPRTSETETASANGSISVDAISMRDKNGMVESLRFHEAAQVVLVAPITVSVYRIGSASAYAAVTREEFLSFRRVP